MPQAFLKGNELDQLVGAFDVWRAILQRARRGGRAGQALRSSGVLFERNKIRRIGAELHAEIEHKIVDGTRLFDILMYGFLRRPHAILGDAPVVTCEQHRPFGKRNPDRIVGL